MGILHTVIADKTVEEDKRGVPQGYVLGTNFSL